MGLASPRQRSALLLVGCCMFAMVLPSLGFGGGVFEDGTSIADQEDDGWGQLVGERRGRNYGDQSGYGGQQGGNSGGSTSVFKTDASQYRPEEIDWSAVITACRGVCLAEKRTCNFIIRTTFHDSLAVDPRDKRGGADGSIFLQNEMMRPENKGFVDLALHAILGIAQRYGSSLADTTAVCGAVAIEYLADDRFKIIGPQGRKNFPVGRLDSTSPDAMGQLPSPSSDLDSFIQFWLDRGFTIEDAIVLMGSHSLIEKQNCARSPRPGDDCDPNQGPCGDQVAMFKWDSHYYEEACLPLPVPRPDVQPPPVDLKRELFLTQCRFSSQEGIAMHTQLIQAAAKNGKLTVFQSSVDWQCPNGNRNWCPHRPNWPYTVLDANLGQACINRNVGKHSEEVGKLMRKYRNVEEWDKDTPDSYIKMVSTFANFANGKKTMINGKECHSGGFDLDRDCANQAGLGGASFDYMCRGCNNGRRGQCHRCCKCRSSIPQGTPYMPKVENVPYVSTHEQQTSYY